MTNTCTFDFAGASVLVTGGTSGIGHAIATAFSDAGASVLVTGTRASAADYDTDLSGFDFRQVEMRDLAAIDALVAELGVLDVLVNNAGANFPDGRDEWEPDAFAASLALNLEGAMRLTVGAGDALKSSSLRGGASVVSIVSMGSFRAVPVVPGYCASKAALQSLTQNLALLWVGDGVRVNAVAPGLVDTPMTAPMASYPPVLESELARVPMGRMAHADEIAGSVLFLSSAAASYVTGTVLAVDGGFLAR